MISDTYLSALKQARKDFMEGTGHPEMIIREEVLDSWRRSRAFHINAQDARCNILTQEQLQKIRSFTISHLPSLIICTRS